MPRHLFDVPGWSVPTEPLSLSSSKQSKKRKRPHGTDASSEKLESAQVNLDKLMDTLERADPTKRPPKKKHKGKKSTDSAEGVADNKFAAATLPKASSKKAKLKDVKGSSGEPKGTHTTSKEKGIPKPHHPPKTTDSVDPNLTTLQNRMKKKLDGARFR
jgi:ribosomal RNA-processing protein 8